MPKIIGTAYIDAAALIRDLQRVVDEDDYFYLDDDYDLEDQLDEWVGNHIDRYTHITLGVQDE